MTRFILVWFVCFGFTVGVASCRNATDVSDADTDTDTDTDTDSDTDTDTDSDTDTDTDDGGCTASGNWYDEETGLCWQNPSSKETKNWWEAAGVEHPKYNPGGAQNYCGNLSIGGFDDWRLPTIDELITLIRGCQDGVETGDYSPSLCTMTPKNCSETNSCENVYSCSYCDLGGGPADGMYLDPSLEGESSSHWSSSTVKEDGLCGWVVAFTGGDVGYSNLEDNARNIRCVRNE